MIPAFLRLIATSVVTDRGDDLRMVLWVRHRSTASLRGEFTAAELHQIAEMMDALHDPLLQAAPATQLEMRRAG
jgi:hypothetical protein